MGFNGWFGRTFKRRRRGSALLVAIVFISLFGCLALGYLAAANGSLRSARLQIESRRAQMAAESGLNFARRAIPAVTAQHSGTMAEMLGGLASGLNTAYRGTLFDHDKAAVVQGNTLVVPALVLNFPEGNGQFEVRIEGLSSTSYVVRSHGTFGEAVKTVRANFRAARDSTVLSRYGVASRSMISLFGQPTIRGVNNNLEGSVLSSTRNNPTPIILWGTVNVSGDVSITNPDGNIFTQGSVNIGGEMRKGVQEPAFPDVNTSLFKPYATHIVDSTTKTSGNLYMENILIKANTNPTFNGPIVLHGVIYVESPNIVTFGGSADIVGVIVCERGPGPLDLANNRLLFQGDSSSDGVEALPHLPQFEALRQLGGAFLLAPGFAVEFTGNFSTINGSILGSQMTFQGNARGTIRGSILNYEDTSFRMASNANVAIDHSGMNDNPAGMVFPWRVSYSQGTYNE